MSNVHLVLPGAAPAGAGAGAAAAAAGAAGAFNGNPGNNNNNRENNKMYNFAKLDAEGSFSESVERSLRKAGNVAEGRPNEILADKCGLVLIVLDNSMSMSNRDGKVVSVLEDGQGKVAIRRGASRWEEACSKVRHIIAYNERRKMQTAVFLLNPRREKTWRSNEDYCVIDPSAGKGQRENVRLRLEEMVSCSPGDCVPCRATRGLDSLSFRLYPPLLSPPRPTRCNPAMCAEALLSTP